MFLKDYMEEKGYTQQYMAKLLGIPQSTLNDYVHGKSMPDLAMGKRIERLTQAEVSIDDLIECWQRNKHHIR